MPRPFLTARWTDLAIITYAVPPSLLALRLPRGLELDTRDGRVFVSLVAFNFAETRVLGVRWPGYRDFPELNLRYYVRRGTDRGVVFLREFVGKRLVAWLANWLYCENYRVAPVASTVKDLPDSRTMELRLTWAGRTHTLAVTGRKPAFTPPETGEEHFFKEHRWGFGVDRRGRPLRYEVIHPVWAVYPVQSYHVDLDWSAVYGPEWSCLQDQPPCSVVLAAGSEVAVYPKGRVGASACAPSRPTGSSNEP